MPLDVHWKARLAFLALLGGAGTAAWYVLSSGAHQLYEIETHDAVSGLGIGAPVEMHGVEIGTVDEIRLLDPDTVNIVVSIDSHAPVSRATVATVTSRGLAARGFMGYVYIALEDSGAGSGPPATIAGHRYPVIPAAASRAYTVDTVATDALRQVTALDRLVQSLLDPPTLASLRASLSELRDVLALIAANKARLQALIVASGQDAQQIGSLLDTATIASLKDAVQGFQGVTRTLNDSGARVRALLDSGAQDSRELRPLLSSGSAALQQLRTEVLPQLAQTVGDLDRLTRSLTPLAARVSRDPSSLVRGAVVPPGPGER
jgi:ABC-type transporter Mla subunit MlaD